MSTHNSDSRFSRNWAFITPEEQALMAAFPIFLAGCGLNSLTAECLLRMGFSALRLWDGDKVELSNLNRQDYVLADVGKSKALILRDRLLAIDPDAEIQAHNKFINEDNIREALGGSRLILNTADFDADEGRVSLAINRTARELGITVISPFNLSLGGFAFVFAPDSPSLEDHMRRHPPDASLMLYFLGLAFGDKEKQNPAPPWLAIAIERYAAERERRGADPQMAPGSFLTAGYTAALALAVLRGEKTSRFPEPIFLNGYMTRP